MIANAPVRAVRAGLLSLVLAAAAASPAPAQQPSANAIALAKEIITVKGGNSLYDPVIPQIIDRARTIFIQSNPTLSRDLNEVAAKLRAETAHAGREAARAARVSELLQDTPVVTGPASDDADGYWEVMMLGEAHAVLRDLHERVAVGPVALSPAIVRELRHGSVLNLRLARGPKSWHVVAHGLCYPPVARAALRAASALPV